MKIANYTRFGGMHWETGTLANLLASEGVTNPHTGQPFTEAMLLGIGGGVGGLYMLFEMHGTVILVIGFRNNGQKYKGEFSETICARLGVPVTVKETGGKRAAEVHLREALETGHAVWCTAAKAALHYSLLPVEMAKWFVHGVGVFGIEGEEALVDDRAKVPLRVPLAELAESRIAITMNKNRMLVFGPCAQPPDLAAAITQGIRQCIEEARNPPIRNFGLAAWEKWADLAANTKNKKGWPNIFTTSPLLWKVLNTMFRSIELDEAPGGWRGMYADFLEEASAVLVRPGLQEVAVQYRTLAAQWSELAALPGTIMPAFAEVQQLRLASHRLFREQGPAATPEREALQRRREAIHADPPCLPQKEVTALFAEIAARVRALHQAEHVALDTLETCL